MSRHRVRMLLCLTLGVTPLATAGPEAQTTTATAGAVAGVVKDSSHAFVPGVTVRLTGPALITARVVRTDRAGAYRFAAVPPGDHTLTFELAGFRTIARSGVHVGVGFTATVNVEMSVDAVTDRVDVVTSRSSVDAASTEVTTRFDAKQLARLPGARDFFALAANTPGIAMSKVDVGGNGALALQDYTVYGLRATTGMNRNEVEGIRVGGANGANDNYYADFASFAEIAIKAAGNTAAMPVPGTLTQYVSKSGGNQYHGNVYAGFQDGRLQAANIDASQIARGVRGGPGLDVRNVNRLERFRDVSADLGGFLREDRTWWYGAYRSTLVQQRYPWLLDAPVTIEAAVGTAKITHALSPGQKLIAYLQRQSFAQSSFFNPNMPQPIAGSDALPSLDFPIAVWKGEYNAAVGDAVYLEARVGAYLSNAKTTFKSTEPRIVDTGRNTVSGGALDQPRLVNRPQANGSVSFTKKGWAGSHTFRVGGELMADHVVLPNNGYGNPCNCVSTLNNGAPTQVQILLGTNVSKYDLVTAAGFVEDTWRVGPRVTLSLGVRLDRYQPGLPPQEGPAGQSFPEIDPVLTFSNWGPRLGMTGDLTGDGRTVLKLHYGQFWLYPGPNFTSAFNPNPSGWSQTYLWTDDANRNGRWDAGEEGPLTSVSGGIAATRLDPAIGNTHVHQTTAYLEREVGPDLTFRTGLVVNARRQAYGTINASRPLAAYSVPTDISDPGPDGRLGSADDGGPVTVYGLAPEFLGRPPVNLTTNLPGTSSDYYTWEIAAAKAPSARWSMRASFTSTWAREASIGPGNDFTPNALVSSAGGRDRFTTWQAKAQGMVGLPRGFVVVPVMRHQSGTPFARTFVRTLNYGNATIEAEPIAANRTPNITIIDVRTEKAFRAGPIRTTGFIGLYNIFNSNAAQTLITSSGDSWLRPTAITGPRIARLGVSMDW